MSEDITSTTTAPTPIRGRGSFIASDLVRVIVGHGDLRKEFLIHRNVIMPRSKFIANRLSGRWSNSEPNTINLYELDEDLEPDVVARYLEIVYTAQNNTDSTDDKFLLFKVYVLAEQMEDVKTRNIVLSAIYERMILPTASFPTNSCIRIIYGGTASSKNPARRLLVERARIRALRSFWTKESKSVDNLPKEFFAELALALFEKGRCTKQESERFRVNIADYLEEEEEEER
ncbi:hypothetical protein NX059_003171 [Plenodomus lindquistii]|nr:hypothetical protein NX059_003171 [Plenodomus lindquistii]